MRNVYEIFEDFKKVKSKKDRIDVLRNNDNWALRNVLLGAFDKNIEFAISVPKYKVEDRPGIKLTPRRWY